jgi:hypothetical protein
MLKSLEKTVPRYITNDASSPVIVGKCGVGDKKKQDLLKPCFFIFKEFISSAKFQTV